MNRLINGYTVSISDFASEGFVVPDNQEVALAVIWWPSNRNCTYLAFVYLYLIVFCECFTIEPCHEISDNVVCVTSKGSDQPAHTRRLIRFFTSRLNIL